MYSDPLFLLVLSNGLIDLLNTCFMIPGFNLMNNYKYKYIY